MCGIAGWLGTLPNRESDAAHLVQALHHRGPDAHGMQSWPEATLVHTRLSIIDLSPTGAQPMANQEGTVWTVFNGEIYNHHELRRGLEARGHVFKGRSDTEVLPHLYEEEGSAFVAKLRGMFALAIYDVRTKTLVLARDRFGIKPLFYAPGTNSLAFASEISALLELPGIDDRPDKQAIFDFAALFYITPDPAITFAQAADRADALVTEAVCRQMESDVPLGALLSGGIDSSLVSAAAQAALSDGLRTFNVRFSEKEYDETWAAVAVAKHIGSCHETLDIDDAPGTWEHVTGLLRHAGQPFADTSLFAAHAVCRLMRRHVTVALSGDGGDEGFGGYDVYWQIARIARWQRLPVQIRRGGAALLASIPRLGGPTRRLPQRMRELNSADNTSVIQSLHCRIGQEEHSYLCREMNVLPVRRLFEPHWEHALPPRACRLEHLSAHATEVLTRLILPNDFLCKVDTASMRESLEVRVPMLDEDLFAFGLSLPHSLKVNGRTCKRVLRAVAARRLPSAVATKPKMGFGIPVDAWVDADFKVRLRDALLGTSSKLSEFCRPEAYRPTVEAFCDRHPCPGISRQGLYQQAIMLLSLHLALERRTVPASLPR
jgi:asparagine synthase (glutamine-hydrolysing)